MKSKISLFFLSIILVFASGCSNKNRDYLKDGETIIMTKNVGEQRINFAIELFKKELEIHPGSWKAQFDLAMAYGHLKSNDYSIQLLTNSIEQREKELSKFYQGRGIEKFVKKNYDSSIKDFESSLKFDSTNIQNYKLIVESFIWKKYLKNGKWLKFDKMDIASLIHEVYPKDSQTPTVDDFIKTKVIK